MKRENKASHNSRMLSLSGDVILGALDNVEALHMECSVLHCLPSRALGRKKFVTR